MLHDLCIPGLLFWSSWLIPGQLEENLLVFLYLLGNLYCLFCFVAFYLWCWAVVEMSGFMQFTSKLYLGHCLCGYLNSGHIWRSLQSRLNDSIILPTFLCLHWMSSGVLACDYLYMKLSFRFALKVGWLLLLVCIQIYD